MTNDQRLTTVVGSRVVVATRVLFVEDDLRYQNALRSLLGAGDLELDFASSGAEALERLKAEPRDVCVVDLGLPDVDGVELIASIARTWPALPVVVLSVASSEARILSALRAGAMGYLLKEDAGRMLARALEDALHGGAPMSPRAARLVLSEIRGPEPKKSAEPEPPLTPREVEILEFLAKGHSYGDVGTALGVSINTVRTHVRSIYDKLVVASKTEAVMMALRLGLIEA